MMATTAIQARFQPIVGLQTGRVVGFEALARPAPDRRGQGTTPPDGWLTDGGLAAEMLEQAAAAIPRWRQLPGHGDLFVHVNVTSDDLEQPDLPDRITELRARHRLPRGVIQIEITEQLPIANMAETVKRLLALKGAGVGLVLDDFGSGYSSLAWLHDLPADGLKIDGDLTAKLGSERGNVILAATVQLGHALGLCVTAEGVEDVGKTAQLRAIGVDQVQGFGFGRPMRAEDVAPFLERGGAETGEPPASQPPSAGDRP
ncbi:MAG: EAL domain-containing protein [Pseudomonadota bacterium]